MSEAKGLDQNEFNTLGVFDKWRAYRDTDEVAGRLAWKVTSLTAESNALREQIATLTAERDQKITRIAALNEGNRKYRRQREEARAERDSLRAAHAAALVEFVGACVIVAKAESVIRSIESLLSEEKVAEVLSCFVVTQLLHDNLEDFRQALAAASRGQG